MKNLAWHFTRSTLRDGSPIPAIGQTLIYTGKVKICRSGYHWSRTPAQALEYAPGNLLHLVEVDGVVTEQKDKGVSIKRTILKTVNVTYLLRRYAADEALSVKHLWAMPAVTEQYLTSLDESLKKAAGAAAGAAARDAAWSAAGAAARAAARAAAGAAARAAARDAAWSAARDVAWSAIWSAAGDAARAAAGDAARATSQDRFNNLVYKEFCFDKDTGSFS